MIRKVQKPLTRDQVHGLVAGTLNGYEGLISLDGEHFSVTSEGGMFEGVTQFTVGNSGKLGEIVANSFGLTLATHLPETNVRESTTLGLDATDEEAAALLNSYISRMDETETNIQRTIAQDRVRAATRVNQFTEAMQGLRDARRTYNVQEVADAIEDVAEVANWGTRVEVRPVYDAAKAMHGLARFNDRHLNSINSFRVLEGLSETLYSARATELSKVGPFTVWESSAAEPNDKQIYSSSLDAELVARDLVR